MRPEFERHALSPLGTQRYNALDEAFSVLLNAIDEHCKANVREKANAIHRLTEANSWAHRALVFDHDNLANGNPPPPSRASQQSNFQ